MPKRATSRPTQPRLPRQTVAGQNGPRLNKPCQACRALPCHSLNLTQPDLPRHPCHATADHARPTRGLASPAATHLDPRTATQHAWPATPRHTQTDRAFPRQTCHNAPELARTCLTAPCLPSRTVTHLNSPSHGSPAGPRHNTSSPTSVDHAQTYQACHTYPNPADKVAEPSRTCPNKPNRCLTQRAEPRLPRLTQTNHCVPHPTSPAATHPNSPSPDLPRLPDRAIARRT